jgi:predicted transcriptional regulator
MQQIIRGEKNYEFRRYLISPSVKRVWFYLNAPLSHISYICVIDPARTRKEGDIPLIEDGLGNKEFNERHKDWDCSDFAYRVRSVYKLRKPIGLQEFKSRYGMKAAPRGLVYVPDSILKDVIWSAQERLLPQDKDDHEAGTKLLLLPGPKDDRDHIGMPQEKRNRSAEESIQTTGRKSQVHFMSFEPFRRAECFFKRIADPTSNR